MNTINKTTIFRVAWICIFFSFSVSINAQLQGFVKTGPEGKGMGGVTVSVKEYPSISTITGSGGSYSLSGLPTGERITVVANSLERVLFVRPGVNILNFLFNVVTDYDGNSYNGFEIYDQASDANTRQLWIDKNLMVTHYRDGTPIPNVTGAAEWESLTGPGYSVYNNDAAQNLKTYGVLYNWYTVNTGQLCPTGWHVSTDGEWERFTSNIGGLSTAGAKMKETGTLHWASPNTGATNESNFTALPAGERSSTGNFWSIHDTAFFWTSTGISLNKAYWYRAWFDRNDLGRESGSTSSETKNSGFSVRCLQDTITTEPVTVVTTNSAQSGGSVHINRGPNITVKGVCWSTSQNPTPSDFHTETTTFPPGTDGLGNFAANLTGLDPNTTYFMRAYATDESGGTMYGSEVKFKTYNSDAITDYDGNYYNKVKIGSQVWLSENLKVTHFQDATNIQNVEDGTWENLTAPGYCWYDNDVKNKDNYGALYNWYTVSDDKICPTGWHVPTDNEWTTLANYLGGESAAGGKLKETGTIHWLSPNSGATDEVGFTALPGGFRVYNGVFNNVGLGGYWWSSSENGSTQAYGRDMGYDISFIDRMWGLKNGGLSVRCLQNEIVTRRDTITPHSATCGGHIINVAGRTITSSGVCWGIIPNPTTAGDHTSNGPTSGNFMTNITGLNSNTVYYVRAYFTDGSETVYGNEISFKTYKPDAVKDVDGNFYNQVKIGSQVWLSENLKTTRLNNGSQIPEVKDIQAWRDLTGPGYSWYDNDTIANKFTYGALYNWYAVNTGRLCPVGWHVSTDAEWDILTTYLGGTSTSGNKLKELGTTHWDSPNADATNETGFTALPGGLRSGNGIFTNVGIVGSWYTSTESSGYVWSREMFYSTSDVSRYGYGGYIEGNSVRCIQDLDTLIVTNVADNGLGSLRQAIEYANSKSGYDTIRFNIPGEGPFAIKPETALPAITDSVVIDGYTQPGAAPATASNPAKILIELNGELSWSQDTTGFTIIGGHSVIKGLAINRFRSSGIALIAEGGNTIAGNYIGTTTSGKDSIGFMSQGILIRGGSSNNKIGGTTAAERNIISGNSDGILIAGGNQNSITGNYLGVDVTGMLPIGNKHNGIQISSTATNCHIGDTLAGAGNIIAFNNENGIAVVDNGTIYIKILSNSIYSNGHLGIDLGILGVTPNDSVSNGHGGYIYDSDTGPNNLQNFPVLTSLNFDLGYKNVQVGGYLESTPNNTCTIQFFASKVGDNTGYGEGQNYLGSTIVKTDINGKASFSSSFSISSSWGDVITATTTDKDGNTSEFSRALGGLQDQIVPADKWPLHYKVNEDGIPRITDNSDIAAVNSAFQTWANITTAKITFVDDKTTSQKYASATDSVNLVSFVDDKFPFPPRVLAMAAKTLKISPDDSVAHIIDADIVVNPAFVRNDVGVGYTNSNAGYYDAQSIITHEIGHILGLVHSGLVSSTMFFTLDSGLSKRSLEQDDKSWASYKYPNNPGYNTTFGSITGKITYGDDASTPPVAGALIFAINNATHDTIHAYSDVNGYYSVPGLPAGTYNIYIQPLDGDVYGYTLRPGNINTYLYCNTIYTDYPAEFLSVGESSIESSDTPQQINVSVGSNTKVADIITNKDITPPSLIKVRPTDLQGDKISVLSNFIISFSEPVNQGTFTVETCYLELNGTKYGGSYETLADSSNIIVFNPDSVLQYSTQYVLNLTTGITDLKGNSFAAVWQKNYTTVNKDTEPPKLIGTSPINGADSVFVTSNINVFFSEPMNTESVNNNLIVSWQEGSSTDWTVTTGSLVWESGKAGLEFIPDKNLSENSKYRITISSVATDLSGNHLKIVNGNDTSVVFYTVKEAAPQVIYLGPKNMQTSITVETPVVADFSEPIDPSSITNSTFSLKAANSTTQLTGVIEFVNENSRVVFRPDANLQFNTQYSIHLTTGIKDVSQTVKNLSADITSVFTTAIAPAAPVISYLDPPSGVVGAMVLISGTGFDPDPSKNLVSFNGITAAVESASLNTLKTHVPVSTLSGPVSVTVKSKTSNNMQFDIIPDYMNDPDYTTSSKTLGSKSSGGTAVSGSGEAVFAMVTNPENNSVNYVGLGSKAGSDYSVNVGLYPMNVDIDPLGKFAYVTNFSSHDVSVINLATKKVVKTIPVGVEPYGIVVMRDGKRVYVSNYYSGNLSMIDVDPASGGFDHVVSDVPTGTNSRNVEGTSDAGMVLVTGDFGLKIINSDPKSEDYNSVKASIAMGTKTDGVTSTPDAGFAIVSTLEDKTLLIINLHPDNDDYSGALVSSLPAGNVSKVKADPNAIYIYATDTENNQILVYKLSRGGSAAPSGSGGGIVSLVPLKPITGVYAPQGLAINSAGDKIYTTSAISSSSSSGRQFTTISMTGLKISPEKTIEGLIATVQTLIDNKCIKTANGNELISYLNAALNYLAAGKTKDAINRLNTFVVKVQDYIKSKQLDKTLGQPLVDVANAIILQLKGSKSDDTELSSIIETNLSDQNLIPETTIGNIYPNPTRDAITINYEVCADDAGSGKVMVQVFDATGRLINNLVNTNMEPGKYSVTWKGYSETGAPAPHGIYFVRLRAGKVEQVRQVMLIK